MKALFASAVVILTPALCLAAAGEWRPTRNIEVIVGTPAGGPLDATARLIQKYLEPRNAGSAVLVMNKTRRKPRDRDAVLERAYGRRALHLHGPAEPPHQSHYQARTRSRITDVTPLALLTSEYVGMWVRADSPIRSASDLIARMRAQPDSLSFAITSAASGNHIAAGVVLKAAGVDLKRVHFVPYKGSAETTVAVMGGHVDVLMATVRLCMEVCARRQAAPARDCGAEAAHRRRRDRPHLEGSRCKCGG
jgi:putative tricarboxylic transport membrane protein